MNNINKFAAVARIKWIGISRNTMIMLGPIMTLGIVWVCKILYGINTKGELSPGLVSMLLTIGISTNICSDGFIMVGTLIAEEKEKHTLHTLMTSSITGMQYFIGSILFPFFITMIMNLAILWISGASIPLKAMPIFFIVNAIVSIISCVIGMIVGICAKNQMNASLIASPIMMICMMIPMFGNLSSSYCFMISPCIMTFIILSESIFLSLHRFITCAVIIIVSSVHSFLKSLISRATFSPTFYKILYHI